MNGHEVEPKAANATYASYATPAPVPLPTDLPPPPDLKHLPADILHSGSVETLIGQNEDLFARLKVNIRRNSVLEGQILEQERKFGEMMRINKSLSSQLQIMEEKDEMWRDKTTRAESNQDVLKDELDLLKARLDAAEEQSDELRPSARYERRVRRWVRPFIDRLMNQLNQEKKNVLAKEAVISDLRARLTEATQYAQTVEMQSTRDQARLVEQYEAQQKIITSELEKIRNESKLLRDKAMRLDKAVTAEAFSQNQLIALERQNTDLKAQVEAYKQDAKHVSLQTRDREEQMKKARAEADELRNQLSAAQDQFESLQTVWSDTQKRLDAMKTQHESLNKLNQELSRQLKEKRVSESLQAATPAPIVDSPTPKPTNDVNC